MFWPQHPGENAAVHRKEEEEKDLEKKKKKKGWRERGVGSRRRRGCQH